MSEPTHLLSIPGFSDPVSSLSHLAGALCFGILGISLIARGRGDAWRAVSLAIFAFSCVLLLSLSGVYHLLAHDTAARSVLMRLDHAAIFVLIAGSFTPVHAILLHRRWHQALLLGIWLAAIAGLTLKTVYFNTMPEWLGLAMYLGLGWLGTISTVAIARRFGWRFVLPLLWGALAYTLGALADHFHWPVLVPDIVGPHEVFHFAVLAGISFHWAFIRAIASPLQGYPSFHYQRAVSAHADPRDDAVALLCDVH
jgi:channel protein (hemolysin III family)